VKIVVAALVGAALTTSALVAAPAQASTAEPRSKEIFSLTAEFSTPRVLATGNARGVGDLTVSTSSVTGTSGSGSATMLMRVLGPGGRSDSEMRDTQVQVQLRGGQIFAQGVTEDPKRKIPETLHILTINGGTGAYVGARGTLNLIRMARSTKHLMMFDFFTDRSLPRSTLTFASPVKVTQGSGPGGITLARAVRDQRSYVSVATGLGSGRQGIDLQVFDGDSTIYARSVAGISATSRSFAVLGGTGTYAGARGELILNASGQAMSVRVVKPRGKSASLAWRNNVKRGVSIGNGAYSSGDVAPARGNSPRGTFFSSTLTYPEVDGIVPVISMYSQSFTTGPLLAGGMHLGGARLRIPVIGGTGEYAGATGSVAIDSRKPQQVRMSGTFWR